MGRKHYTCDLYGGMSCETVCESSVHISDEGKAGGYCGTCVYRRHKELARRGNPTFFNPMSFMYLLMQMTDKDRAFDTVVIDEAHSLIGMLHMMTGAKFWQSQTALPDDVRNELDVLNWFAKVLPNLMKQHKLYSLAVAKCDNPRDRKDALKRLQQIEDQIDAITNIKKGLTEEPQNYAIWFSEETRHKSKDKVLNVKPIKLPRYIVRNLFSGVANVVFLSGTLLEHDLKELVGDEAFTFEDFPSPISKDRRLIYHEPLPYQVNFQTSPQQLAKDILKKCAANPGNTLIHVTYEWSKRLAPFMPAHVLTNNPENKLQVLDKFKKDGGIFLAAGCAEGIDLPDDLCRTNIIPILAYPNINDEVVKKRKALADGDLWYKLETLKTVIQQAGRSTRHEKDMSKTIVMVPAFKWVAKSVWTKLPESFRESIVWKK